MPSAPCSPEGERREVITSSKTSRLPAWRVSSRSIRRNSSEAGMQPPPPSIGSRMTQARSAALARIMARVPSTSL